MPDTPISNGQATDKLLTALAEQLAVRGEHYALAVVGGSALLALELISRATRDVDVLAIVEAGQLLTAEPLPDALRDAAQTVARDFGLQSDWLNPGPTTLLDLGLPEDFHERAELRTYGSGLDVLFASRFDQIHFKLYATVDQGAGKHLSDLRALAPTEQELLDAAAWSRTQDPSEGYLAVLQGVLAHLGVNGGTTAS
jgi:hypothetical protein